MILCLLLLEVMKQKRVRTRTTATLPHFLCSLSLLQKKAKIIAQEVSHVHASVCERKSNSMYTYSPSTDSGCVTSISTGFIIKVLSALKISKAILPQLTLKYPEYQTSALQEPLVLFHITTVSR